jgi:adenine-specific DNA-methyltransferase
MKRVFVGGSRRISRLNEEVRRRLDQMMDREMRILVGDANGADRAVQTWLHEHGYSGVTIFCTGGKCRNNVGGWPVEVVQPPHPKRDFAFYTAKDAAMAEGANAGFMLWDGESPGTVVNVARLVGGGKSTLVWVRPGKAFLTLQTLGDLPEMLRGCSNDTEKRIMRYLAEHAPAAVQHSMF